MGSYEETLAAIGEHEAAMLVKWLLAPVRGYAANIAHRAHEMGLYHTTRGLTEAGTEFALEHAAREVQRLSGKRLTTQGRRFYVRCPACKWRGWRVGGEPPLYYGFCPRLGCVTLVARRTKGEPEAYPCPDCKQTTGHAEDCGLSFGAEFAQRQHEREVK